MAPKYGSTIVKTVLESDELTAAWMADLNVMSGRIKTMRQALYDELIRLETPGTWNHIVDQVSEVKAIRERNRANTIADRHVLIHRPDSL